MCRPTPNPGVPVSLPDLLLPHQQDDSRTRFDGREVTWEQFGQMLMSYEGWQFKLEIKDRDLSGLLHSLSEPEIDALGVDGIQRARHRVGTTGTKALASLNNPRECPTEVRKGRAPPSRFSQPSRRAASDPDTWQRRRRSPYANTPLWRELLLSQHQLSLQYRRHARIYPGDQILQILFVA